MENREITTVTGRLVKTKMRDHQSGFTVFELRSGTQTHTCKGYILRTVPGLLMKASGTWKETKFGIHLECTSVEEVTNDIRSIVEYLQTIPGVGSVTAERIAEEFGENIYFEIECSPDAVERLMGIKGITPQKAEEIAKHVRETSQQRKLWEVLSKYEGTSYVATMKIFKAYGEESLERFRKDPYTAGSIAGLSFSLCDEIAQNEGIYPSEGVRVEAAVRITLSEAAGKGHTFLPYNELMAKCRRKLDRGNGTFADSVTAMLVDVSFQKGSKGPLIRERNCCYLRHLWYAELNTARYIKRLIEKGRKTDYDVEELYAYAEKVCGVTYAPQQRDAFSLYKDGGVCVITGGPGTGKTTLVKGLLAAYEMLHPDHMIKLAAPTGRASQRMKEATGREAVTIHRLLEFRPFNDVLVHKNADDPIQADMLVLDESSMLDIELSEKLFAAIKPGTTVLIIGDINQLPAVGAGNVLHNLIYSGTVPVVSLTKIHRQAEESLIIKNAMKISDGHSNLVSGPDFEIITIDDDKIANNVNEKFLENYIKGEVFSCQALCPARKKTPGSTTNVSYLNGVLQKSINNDGSGLRYGSSMYRVNDKVMLMRNNYDVGYFNGDVGTVIAVTDVSLIIKVEDMEIELKEELLDDVSLSYSTTVHKSQGSEYDTAIVIMPSSPRVMLQRNLLYTAITRAKSKVVLIASKGSIDYAVSKNDAIKRHSNLIGRLRA